MVGGPGGSPPIVPSSPDADAGPPERGEAPSILR
jgi:hypothetical protein